MNLRKSASPLFPPLNFAMSVLLILAAVGSAKAKTIGTNTAAESITRARIMQLPMAQRSAWLKYLDRSERRRQADKGAFQAELNSAGTTTPTAPPHGFGARSVALDRDLGWYLSADAQTDVPTITEFKSEVKHLEREVLALSLR